MLVDSGKTQIYLMPSFQWPFTLLMQVSAEFGRFLFAPLAFLQPFHNFPFGAASMVLLARWRLRGLYLLLRRAVRAQAVRLHARLRIARVRHVPLDLAHLVRHGTSFLLHGVVFVASRLVFIVTVNIRSILSWRARKFRPCILKFKKI